MLKTLSLFSVRADPLFDKAGMVGTRQVLPMLVQLDEALELVGEAGKD